jgi:pimeloyl-ACP methyl ester carboxylesterase
LAANDAQDSQFKLINEGKMKIQKIITMASLMVLATAPASAATFVIVHGAFQSADSWSQVATSLSSKGHKVVNVNLPGRNAQGSDAKAVSIAQYVDTVSAAVSAQSEPVTLIGHSFGGITISMVGAALPQKIKQLVYVAAYVPLSGESMQTLAASDKSNGFTEKSFVVAPDYSFATILQEDKARLFINDGNQDQQKAVIDAMLREPLGPIGTKVEFAQDKLDRVQKVYVRTTLDKTVSPTIQNMMINRAGIKQVIDIEAGHSPQNSQASKLADLLLQVAK